MSLQYVKKREYIYIWRSPPQFQAPAPPINPAVAAAPSPGRHVLVALHLLGAPHQGVGVAVDTHKRAPQVAHKALHLKRGWGTEEDGGQDRLEFEVDRKWVDQFQGGPKHEQNTTASTMDSPMIGLCPQQPRVRKGSRGMILGRQRKKLESSKHLSADIPPKSSLHKAPFAAKLSSPTSSLA